MRSDVNLRQPYEEVLGVNVDNNHHVAVIKTCAVLTCGR
jgi:hypothetical protein